MTASRDTGVQPDGVPRGWEVVIGLETHTQLATRSKIFSGASTAFGADPNTQACAVDLALPGVLPVVNTAAVEHAIRFGLAVGATIAPRSVFARKNYFYPDLPKGYQISQYELPVVAGGELAILVDGEIRTIELTRAHLEEDAGKSLHEDFHGQTGIDLNRAGTPLLEIVSEPQMRSPAEAVAYARALHGLVTWLGICDGNMQEGSFRVDANVSVRRAGDPVLGTRCEIKNLNSFRFLDQAIRFEIERQIDLIDGGGRVVQETRLYDPDRNETRSMRSKEDAQDYRYFPDPDLPALVIAAERIEAVRATLPELPAARRERYETAYALSAYDAHLLTASREVSDYFEAVLAATGEPVVMAKPASNWITGELSAQLNRDGIEIAAAPVTAAMLGRVLQKIADGTLSGKLGRELFQALWHGEGRAGGGDGRKDRGARADRDPRDGAAVVDALIEQKGMKQISDTGELTALADQVIAANARSVEEFRAGKDKALNALVGQVMKASRGKANPQQVTEILRQRLGA